MTPRMGSSQHHPRQGLCLKQVGLGRVGLGRFGYRYNTAVPYLFVGFYINGLIFGFQSVRYCCTKYWYWLDLLTLVYL